MGAVNLRTVLGLLRPNVASLGYGLFLAINAASVWGGVFPFLPLAFQTTDVMLWFFGAESLAFTATFLASAAGTYFFPAETRHFMVKAVSAPETMPGLISGIMTFQKACIQVQPRSIAASTRLRSICRSLGPTERIT